MSVTAIADTLYNLLLTSREDYITLVTGVEESDVRSKALLLLHNRLKIAKQLDLSKIVVYNIPRRSAGASSAAASATEPTELDTDFDLAGDDKSVDLISISVKYEGLLIEFGHAIERFKQAKAAANANMFPSAADLEDFDFEQIDFSAEKLNYLKQFAKQAAELSKKFDLATIRIFLKIGALCEKEKVENVLRRSKKQKTLSLFEDTKFAPLTNQRTYCTRHYSRYLIYPFLGYLGDCWTEYARASKETFQSIMEAARQIYSNDAELFARADATTPAASVPRRKRKDDAVRRARTDVNVLILNNPRQKKKSRLDSIPTVAAFSASAAATPPPRPPPPPPPVPNAGAVIIPVNALQTLRLQKTTAKWKLNSQLHCNWPPLALLHRMRISRTAIATSTQVIGSINFRKLFGLQLLLFC